MAREINWTANAQRARIAILQYWIDRTGSARFSLKLDGMFRTSLRILAEHPGTGRRTTDPDVRMKAVGAYLIFYTFSDERIVVLSLWHGKRAPGSRPY